MVPERRHAAFGVPLDGRSLDYERKFANYVPEESSVVAA
jgi:hypothetical protein